MLDETRFVRRAPAAPAVWLGERESASLVQPRLGARFPVAKELDFVLELPGKTR